MQKILLLLVVSFFVGKNCEAQNLVPNPSFEDTIGCCCYETAGWISFGDSPDYYNVCNSILSVPNNFGGFQNAATGNAYYGFYSYAAFLVDAREFIGEELTQLLIPGNKYFVNFKVNLSDSSGCATNNIGLSFSTVPFNSVNGAPINNHAFVFTSTIIADKVNWEIISGAFIADSAYQYVMIGNFFNDISTDTSIVSNNFFNGHDYAYYFLDDVCVSPDSLACDLNPEGIYNLKETKSNINLYPNPATEQLIITHSSSFFNGVRELPFDNGQLIIKEIEISDALGRVQSCEFKVQRPVTKIDIHSLPSGIYFIKVYFADGSKEVRRFVKE